MYQFYKNTLYGEKVTVVYEARRGDSMFPHEPTEMMGIEEMEKRTPKARYPQNEIPKRSKLRYLRDNNDIDKPRGFYRNHCAACYGKINPNHSVTFSDHGVHLCYGCYGDVMEFHATCSCGICYKQVFYPEAYIYTCGKEEVFVCKSCLDSLIDGPGCEGQTRSTDCAYCDLDCMNRSMPYCGRKMPPDRK